MAKVIEHQEKHRKKPTRHRCTKCGSLIEYSEDDIIDYYDQRDQAHWQTVECPVCRASHGVRQVWSK